MVEAAVQIEVLERGQFAVHKRLVPEISDCRARDVDLELAFARESQPGAEAEQRRLAGAVRPRDDGEPAGGDVEVDAAQGALLAEALAELSCPDHRG